MLGIVIVTFNANEAVKWKSKTYVLVLEETQHFQFPKHTLRRDERLKHVREFLERHPTSIARICHGPAIRETEKSEIKLNILLELQIGSKSFRT